MFSRVSALAEFRDGEESRQGARKPWMGTSHTQRFGFSFSALEEYLCAKQRRVKPSAFRSARHSPMSLRSRAQWRGGRRRIVLLEGRWQ